MEDRDRLSGEEGIQDTNVLTVVRCPSALLRHSMHLAQFPELVEADSAHHRAATEGTYRGRSREIPEAGKISQKTLVTGVLREYGAL